MKKTTPPRKRPPALSPKARLGNRNAEKPEELRRVAISARVTPEAAAFLRSYGKGDLGRNLDAAAAALRAVDRHLAGG